MSKTIFIFLLDSAAQADNRVLHRTSQPHHLVEEADAMVDANLQNFVNKIRGNHASELVNRTTDQHRSIDNLVDKSVDMLFDRKLRAWTARDLGPTATGIGSHPIDLPLRHAILNNKLAFSYKAASSCKSPTKRVERSRIVVQAEQRLKKSWKSPRIYHSPDYTPLAIGERIVLDEFGTHYLSTVMRLKEGDMARLFNEKDGEYNCRVTHEGKRRPTDPMVIEVDELLRSPPTSGVEISSYMTLYFGIMKKQRLKMLLEKASEIGADVLVPVRTEESQDTVDLDTGWRVLMESAEQSERMDVAKLREPVELTDLLQTWNPESQGRLLVVTQRPSARPLLTAVREALVCGEKGSLLVGAESGFTDNEWDLLESTPFVDVVSFGNNEMAAETAGIIALSIAAAAVDEFNWIMNDALKEPGAAEFA